MAITSFLNKLLYLLLCKKFVKRIGQKEKKKKKTHMQEDKVVNWNKEHLAMCLESYVGKIKGTSYS